METKTSSIDVRLSHVKFSSYAIIQIILAIILGVAVFAGMLAVILVLNKMGVINAVNILMGNRMAHFTVGKLIGISAVISALITVIIILYKMLYITIVNGLLKISNGVTLKLDRD